MINLTPVAVGKVKEILDAQEPKPSGLRIAVVGGGCSGFSYSMAFENAPGMLDKTYEFEGLKVFIDQASMLYLDGAEVDYVESLEGAGGTAGVTAAILSGVIAGFHSAARSGADARARTVTNDEIFIFPPVLNIV